MKNLELIKKLQEIALIDETKTFVDEESVTVIKEGVKATPPEPMWIDNFLDTKVSELNYNNSTNPSFFSKRYANLLYDLLQKDKTGTLSKKELVEVNTRLHHISDSEYRWKDYHKRVVRKETLGKNSPDPRVVDSFKAFEYNTNILLTGHGLPKTQRVGQKILLNRIALSAKNLFSLAVKSKKIKTLYPMLELTTVDLTKVFNSLLSSSEIFDVLVKVIIKGGHEELISEPSASFNDIGVSVSRASIQYNFQKTFLLVLFNILVSHARELKILTDEASITVFERDFESFVNYSPHLYEKTSSWEKHCDDCMSLIQILEKSGLFKERLIEKSDGIKTMIKYVLPDYLEVKVLENLKMPYLVRPQKITKEDIDLLIKPLRFGWGSITKTNHLQKTLTISSHKCFRVNTRFLRLCETIMSKGNKLSKLKLDIGFETPFSLAKARENESTLLKALKLFDPTHYVAANSLSKELSRNHQFSFKHYGVLLSCVDTPKILTTLYRKWKKSADQLVDVKNNVGFANSRLILARMLKGYPIYLTDGLCIRLRLYPNEHWLSRTSGIMKHLLYDYTPKKLTLQGHLNLIRALYHGYPLLLDKFEKFLHENSLDKRTGRSKVYAFVKQHPIKELPDKDSLIFANYYMVIYRQLNSKDSIKTSINIEIDQSASALVFLSYVLRDKKMAKISNVLGGDTQFPYDYLKMRFADYYSENKERYTYDKEAYEFACTDRKLHKYAIMCFCYNQRHLGRMDDFRARWYDVHNSFPVSSQDKFLSEFAMDYPNFVDFVFPNTTKKLNIINKAMTLMARETSLNEIKTLNGEVLRWIFYKQAKSTRRFYDVVDDSYKSYKLVSTNATEVDTNSMNIKFLSYLIHSIDSAIIRKVIVDMKEKHEVYVNHLHDCVMVHPNQVDSLYDVLKHIYLTSDLYNLTDNLVFSQMESQLSPESVEILKTMKNEFYELTDDYEDELKKFNPRNMYKFEG